MGAYCGLAVRTFEECLQRDDLWFRDHGLDLNHRLDFRDMSQVCDNSMIIIMALAPRLIRSSNKLCMVWTGEN